MFKIYSLFIFGFYITLNYYIVVKKDTIEFFFIFIFFPTIANIDFFIDIIFY